LGKLGCRGVSLGPIFPIMASPWRHLIRVSSPDETVRWLERRSKLDVLALSLLALIPIVSADLKLGPYVSLSVLSLAPVFLVACFGGRLVAYTYAVIAGVCWFAADYQIFPRDTGHGVFIWAACSRIGAFVLMAEVSTFVRQLLKGQAALARTDGLTGLANHRALREQAARLLASAQRHASPISAAYIDCDNFKQINDTDGHAAGDQVLKAVAGVLTNGTRPTDLAARVGGDEFVLLMPGTDRVGGRFAVARLQAELSKAMEGIGRNVTFSIGAATFDAPPASVDELLARIDECQYRAKRSGKDRFVYHAAA